MSVQMTRSTGLRVVLAGLVAAVVSIMLNGLLAGAAVSAGADPDVVLGLRTVVYAMVTVAALVLGGIGWALVRARVENPAATLRRLVPATFLFLLVPDFFVGFIDGWTGAFALMGMHVVVAVAAVAAYAWSMPVAAAAVPGAPRR